MPPIAGTDTMPRDGGGTENIQTSANEAAVKNKIYKHLQRILAHFCIR